MIAYISHALHMNLRRGMFRQTHGGGCAACVCGMPTMEHRSASKYDRLLWYAMMETITRGGLYVIVNLSASLEFSSLWNETHKHIRIQHSMMMVAKNSERVFKSFFLLYVTVPLHKYVKGNTHLGYVLHFAMYKQPPI